MATDMSTGGGVVGAVCIMVIWTVGPDGGTNVSWGPADIDEVESVDGGCTRGGPP
jgi:hypothetical protein